MRKLLFILIAGTLAGCLLGPNYHPPSTQVCDYWHSEDAPLCNASSAPPVDWWNLFCDPLLNRYIEKAAFNNKELLKGEANILQARAIRQMTASAMFPQVAADLSAVRTYFSKNGPVFAIGMGQTNANTGLPFQLQIPQTQNLYNALIDVNWEIDLFGKTRRAVEAAEYQIGAFIATRNDILISIEAEVARNYIELRSSQRRGELIAEDIALLERTLQIAKKRLEVGYTNRLDFDRIEAELLLAQANLPNICAQIYQYIYAISVLIGELPETLLCELLPKQPLPTIPQCICIGLRSDLIRRRPDIRYAERNLAAATANIGVAVASFFPSITLTGDIGFQSLSLSNLFQAKSLTWAIGGDVNIPLFQGGNLIGNLRLSEAKAIAAAFSYQQAVLTGLREAETALKSYSDELKTSQYLQEAVHKYEELVLLMNSRYGQGLISLTDVLDIERQWNLSEQQFLNSQTKSLLDLITLYKSLGGGWEPLLEEGIDYKNSLHCIELKD